MEKVTKKDLARKLQHQESRIDRLVEKLARKGFYDDEQEQADHDEVLIILDRKEPKLKQLDQSVFDGLDAKWRFAAVDKCGEVWLSTHKTQPSVSGTHLSPEPRADSKHIKGAYDASNWQNSLIERKELTGSDLCRAMLERGDKHLMCFIGDTSEPATIARGSARIVIGIRKDRFETDNTAWKVAIPINSQGEPLTQSDVGL